MLNDQPTKDDLLGRRPFANSVAHVIARQSDPASQVIAIDGAWGDGKTTVFGFLKDALKDEDLKVMDFNPWRHSDEDTMIRAFALELAKTMGVKILNKREQLVETVQDRAEWFKEAASAVGAEKVGGFFHFGAKRLRLRVEELVDRVRGELNSHARRVTILVDDSDRLEVGQLMGLFRLIKLIADFEWLTFVLAMDCSAIIRTVSMRFGGDDEGRRFLEKIVQVPIRLPAVSHGKLREFTLQLIQRVIDDLGIEIGQDEVVRFRSSFDSTVMPLIRTPRSAKQYANVVRFSLGLLPGEVSPVDVMLLEGMRLFARNVFECVMEHIIPKVESRWMDDIMDKEEDKADKLMKKLLAGADNVEAQSWRDALIMLFPAKLSSASYSESEFLVWTNAKRVACDEYFIRYLAATVPDNDVPDEEVNLWIKKADSQDPLELASSIASSWTSKNEVTLVQKLRRIERQLNDTQRKCFAAAMSQLSSRLTWRDIAWQSEAPFGQAAIFIAQCIENISVLEARESIASDILRSADSGMWAIEVFYFLPHGRENERRELSDEQKIRVFPKDVSSRLGTVLANRLMLEIENASNRPSMPFLRHSLRICASHGDVARIQQWAKRELTGDRDFIGAFASLITNWSYSGEECQQEWPGDKAALSIAKNYVDTEWLAQNFSIDPPARSKNWGSYISDEEAAYQLIKLLKCVSAASPETGNNCEQSQ